MVQCVEKVMKFSAPEGDPAMEKNCSMPQKN